MLLRGNTIATKAMEIFLRNNGAEYLRLALGRFIRQVIAAANNHPIDKKIERDTLMLLMKEESTDKQDSPIKSKKSRTLDWESNDFVGTLSLADHPSHLLYNIDCEVDPARLAATNDFMIDGQLTCSGLIPSKNHTDLCQEFMLNRPNSLHKREHIDFSKKAQSETAHFYEHVFKSQLERNRRNLLRFVDLAWSSILNSVHFFPELV
ncbi:unnamed protein product [Protopolystoma xenopodis]|uniref:Ras-GAP domain-containing protein n=1 Tax=Protopolystoma xenopodis TaxID=117903 RepID=A0A448X8C1_9PLAT|nr:unnamed protein product [Protopolystoma xenopodis]